MCIGRARGRRGVHSCNKFIELPYSHYRESGISHMSIYTRLYCVSVGWCKVHGPVLPRASRSRVRARRHARRHRGKGRDFPSRAVSTRLYASCTRIQSYITLSLYLPLNITFHVPHNKVIKSKYLAWTWRARALGLAPFECGDVSLC